MDNMSHLIESRRSCRKYLDKMPTEEQLRQIAEAGMWAASGKGRQSPLIVMITDKSIRDQLSYMNAKIMGVSSDPFYGAPAVAVVLADRSIPTHVYDGSLVLGNMMLEAHALGLGSCWIHRAKEEFDSAEGKELLKAWDIDGDYEGIGHCVIGYPAQDSPKGAPRKKDYLRWVK